MKEHGKTAEGKKHVPKKGKMAHIEDQKVRRAATATMMGAMGGKRKKKNISAGEGKSAGETY